MIDAPLYLLDTNIISDMMRNPRGNANLQLAARIAQSTTPLRVGTSIVVDCEVSIGLQRKASPKLDKAYSDLLQIVEVMSLDALVTPHYAKLRSQLEQAGTPIGPLDTLIAAHALALGATLVSGDSEFARVPGLTVENWLQAPTSAAPAISTI
jgi:tRNA(fMet)-specific endonuclease VapC